MQAPPAGAGSVRQLIADLAAESLKATFPDLPDVEPAVAVCANTNFGDYQINNAMAIFSRIRGNSGEYRNPNLVGQALLANLPATEMVARTSIAGPGFINLVLSDSWLEKRLMAMLREGVASWAPKLTVSTAVVDFSAPNIAKEMHVGHLRSTIIGETLARCLEYCGVHVLRRNHVGDWGTQFGMLIEYLFEQFPDWDEVGNQAIADLQAFYKAAKLKFDDDADFKKRAQLAVVKLQGGEPQYRAAWEKICEVSRNEFQQVYARLHVTIEEKGESFYNPYIPDVLKELTDKGLVEESKGAQVIMLPGQEVPLIVQKSDGGFNYASTDMTALWYRIFVEKGQWLVYVTDVGQWDHFKKVFEAGRMAGWLKEGRPFPKVSHAGFGLVLGTDGKRFRTRSTEVVKLVDLLDEAKLRAKQELEARITERGMEGWSPEDVEHAAEALGYGAVKYADLKNNRMTNYTFDFDKMLDMKGNTAVYLLYAHARICSIIRRSDKDVEELKKTHTLALVHPSERQLAIDLVRFSEIVESTLAELLPNTLCEYLYNLADRFTSFYTNCQVVGDDSEESRLLLCESTATIMRQCFYLLGIMPLYRL
eukprot:SM000056S18001  [mRNA]  locus=s56:644673:649281:+ [translate_table: standard]